MANFKLSVRFISGDLISELDAAPNWTTEDVIRQLPRPPAKSTYILVCEATPFACEGVLREHKDAAFGSSTLGGLDVEARGELFVVVVPNEVAPVMCRAREEVAEYKDWGAYELIQSASPSSSCSRALIAEALCRLFNVPLKREDGSQTDDEADLQALSGESYWRAAAQVFFNVENPSYHGPACDALVNAMRDYDLDADPQHTLSVLGPFIENPAFTPQQVGQRAQCGSMGEHHLVKICIWLHVLYKYAEVAAGRVYYSEGDVEADLNVGQYEVVLSGTGDLGLRCMGGYGSGRSGPYLRVRGVLGGLAAAWNLSWPQKAMKYGHKIILINGQKISIGDHEPDKILEREFQDTGSLRLQIVRQIEGVH